MARSTITVTSPTFGAEVIKMGRALWIGGEPSEIVRVVSAEGCTLTVTRWRWWHTAAAWPRRAARKARGWAEDLWLKYWPDPEDDGAEILGEDW